MAPGAPLKWKIAWVISRVVLKPVIVTVNPVDVRAAVALEIVGTDGLIRICFVGAGLGVMSVFPEVRCAVSVISPDTVPVCSDKLEFENIAVLEFAGIVKVTVRPPEEN